MHRLHPSRSYTHPQPAASDPAVLEPLEGRRLMSAGDLDPSFGGDGRVTTDFSDGSVDRAFDVAVQADGKSVVVGQFGNAWGIARYNVDGSLDSTFGPGASGKFVATGSAASAVAVQPDGKIVVVGNTGFFTAPIVRRYLSNGLPDTTFSGDGQRSLDFGDIPSANDVVVQADGKIVVLGDTRRGLIDIDFDFGVIRLLPNGSLDNTFGSVVSNFPLARSGRTFVGFGGDDFSYAVALDYNGSPDTNANYGKILIAGEAREPGSDGYDPRFAVARLKTNGTVDNGFGGDGRVETTFPNHSRASARGIVALPGGRVAAVGAVSLGYDPQARADFGRGTAMVAYRSDGSPDPLFGFTGDGLVVNDLPGEDWSEAVIVGHGGNLLLGGSAGGDFAVTRFRADGILDTAFGQSGVVRTDFGGSEGVGALAPASDGRFVAAGTPEPGFLPAHNDFVVARYFDVAPTVSVFAVDTTATENANDPASFIVTRDQYLPFATRVYFTVGGTATPPGGSKLTADYTGISREPGTGRWYVDIPAGQNFAVVTIRPVIDGFPEETETAVFTISPGIGRPYDVSPFNTGVTILIENGPPLTTV
jgi:uncharacterized delta-60 repeat protein